MIEGDLQKKLERFEASVENKAADGPLLEELVEQCAPDIPDWEVSDCWALGDYCASTRIVAAQTQKYWPVARS